MSKIEELALIDLPVTITGNGWNDWDENEVLRKGYILGAKAILREIEKLKGNYVGSSGYYAIMNKIRELKGE